MFMFTGNEVRKVFIQPNLNDDLSGEFEPFLFFKSPLGQDLKACDARKLIVQSCCKTSKFRLASQ